MFTTQTRALIYCTKHKQDQTLTETNPTSEDFLSVCRATDRALLFFKTEKVKQFLRGKENYI